MKSILQDYEEQKQCFACSCNQNLEDHHIFNGPNRKLSEKYGLKVLLCMKHHRDNIIGVHGQNTALRKTLQQLAQREFEKVYGHDKYMQVFRRNYLD